MNRLNKNLDKNDNKNMCLSNSDDDVNDQFAGVNKKCMIDWDSFGID